MEKEWNQILVEVKEGISFAQRLQPKLVYSIKEDAIPIAGSERTAYRRLNALRNIGLAQFNKGRFNINRAVRQPDYLFQKLLPSLIAFKNARRFGKLYSDADVKVVKKIISDKMPITLDYAAWELTNFQTPLDYYSYTENIEETATQLKEYGFSEGEKGHIVLLPKIGEFSNNIQRVYLDCIAKGGRNTQDAIAIEITHGDKLEMRGVFPVEYVTKVKEDMPKRMLEIEAIS